MDNERDNISFNDLLNNDDNISNINNTNDMINSNTNMDEDSSMDGSTKKKLDKQIFWIINTNYQEDDESNIVTNNDIIDKHTKLDNIENTTNEITYDVVNDTSKKEEEHNTKDNNVKKINNIFSSKKFLFVLSIITFIVVGIVVFKAFYFGKKVDNYEEFFTEITKIEDNAVKVYQENKVDNSIIKKMAASELINCIKEPMYINNLPEDINNIINEINNYYNTSNNYFAFGYKDIFTGFTVSYNANQNIFTASAIKGPTDIYIYEMASQGKVDLDEMVTYTGNYYNTGSGVLKNKPINTEYSVRTLLEYSTVTSDNAAHNILMDKFGRNNMHDFWSNLGTTAIFTANNNWGVLNVHDALIYMSELYDFYARDDIYGEAIMTNFLNAYPTFLKGNGNCPVANKSGWSGTTIHDIAIVFVDNPYIVVALSNTGTSDYNSYFENANRLAYELHNAYWKYKIDSCENIKQY